MKTLSPESQRALTLLCVVSALACVVFAGIVGTSSLGQGQQIEENTDNAETAKSQVKVARDKVIGSDSKLERTVRRLTRTQRKQDRAIRRQNALIRDLKAAGARLPSVVAGDRGPAGFTGDRGPGPTTMQIRAAIAAYCESHLCGVPPTQAQVNAAIRACSLAGGCRGADGKDGRDSTVPGPQGPAGIPGLTGPAGPPSPMMPCDAVDPALRYQCVPAQVVTQGVP